MSTDTNRSAAAATRTACCVDKTGNTRSGLICPDCAAESEARFRLLLGQLSHLDWKKLRIPKKATCRPAGAPLLILQQNGERRPITRRQVYRPVG